MRFGLDQKYPIYRPSKPNKGSHREYYMEFPQSIALEQRHMASTCGLKTLMETRGRLSNGFMNFLIENVPRKKVPNKRVSNIDSNTR
jgi:hypothetical protein